MSNRLDEDELKIAAIEIEYGPNGIEDEHWDTNFTKDMIRNDVIFLLNKIKELKQINKFLVSQVGFCQNCTCGKSGNCNNK